jgi:hypothetical protein
MEITMQVQQFLDLSHPDIAVRHLQHVNLHAADADDYFAAVEVFRHAFTALVDAKIAQARRPADE